MNEIRIVIPDVPPSNNQFIGRNARWKYQQEKQAWHWKLKAAIRKRPDRPLKKAYVHIHYDYTDSRRRDPDNYSGKFLLDALVREKIIEDDSFQHMDLTLTASFRQPKKQTVITVTEVVECQTGS